MSKESTVDFLRQFARAYNPLPLANASLSGIITQLIGHSTTTMRRSSAEERRIVVVLRFVAVRL